MEIREIINKQEWEHFLRECHQKTFLQSWSWGEFQQSLGYKIWRFGIYENDKLISVTLVIKHVAKRGSFLLVPHGPVDAHSQHQEILATLKPYLRDLAKKEKVDLIAEIPMNGKKESLNVAVAFGIALFRMLGV